MAHHHVTLNGASHRKRQGTSLQELLSWVMVLLVLLVSSVSFAFDHLLPIFR